MTLSILEQRRIEAAFAKGIYEEMAAELGPETAQRILSRAVVKLARQAAAEMAKEAPEGQASLEHFRSIQPRWTREDALRVEVVRQDETHFDFNVTRCRYAETYRAMGLGELGAILSCNRDGAFCEGYDPKLKMTRTQTIMGGASHCDFRYRWEEEAPAAPPAGPAAG
ncbi:L-2-amino-thiazoline-4-carboxylic acid hydrolase [Pseudoroseomonas cervicalis]|uniref:L-2-amino-thiazoline-4-carboxylic acid hydrolase n=1 Tax=Teichococcus cervicalis TaxID=204525 RepID=UPI0027829E34|nr:L-2-amino-thiazoline-4-carboxylic acid hydrolase [Pseudoroseomonas cervicalis]MDQ1078436.1 hypothetical protein [Pseudoroseomonas cervicalis]